MSLQYFDEKNIFLSKCLFIFLSQYCVQKCLVCIRPKWDFQPRTNLTSHYSQRENYRWPLLYARDKNSKNRLTYKEFGYKKIKDSCKLENWFQKKAISGSLLPEIADIKRTARVLPFSFTNKFLHIFIINHYTIVSKNQIEAQIDWQKKLYKRPSLFADFLSANSLIDIDRIGQERQFSSQKWTFYFQIQNLRSKMYLQRVARETCT